MVPLLLDQCVECHRAEKAKGGYRLDTFEQLVKAGDSDEPPLMPGKPEESELFELIATHDEDDRMPKKADALSEAQVALVRQWISEGAKFDGKDVKASLSSLVKQKDVQSPAKYPQPVAVTAMALNGDGKVLVTNGYHEVLAWDPETGKIRGRISGMPERVLGLSFVKGGPMLAVAGGSPGRSGEVWLVNYAQPKERQRLAQLRDCALGVVTTPDGRVLITAGADNHVRAFALPEGKPMWSLEAHADWILGLAMSADGKHVASASRDRTAKVFEVKSGTVEGTFTGHDVAVLSVAFSPAGDEVISGDVNGEMHRFRLNGEGVKDTTMSPGGRSEVLGLGFITPELPVAALGSGAAISIDAKARKKKDALAQHDDRLTSMCVSGAPESRRLITASHDGWIRITEVSRSATSPAGPLQIREFRRFVASPGW
ncbi:MAG: c-type cytochrome domain-containing protein [Verrucomicrobiota bacterium]